MDTNEIESIIRSYILEHFLAGRTEALTPEGILLGTIIDSTGLLEFVSFLQERFGITVEDEEVIPENLESVKAASNYVFGKQRGKVEKQ